MLLLDSYQKIMFLWKNEGPTNEPKNCIVWMFILLHNLMKLVFIIVLGGTHFFQKKSSVIFGKKIM